MNACLLQAIAGLSTDAGELFYSSKLQYAMLVLPDGLDQEAFECLKVDKDVLLSVQTEGKVSGLILTTVGEIS